MKLRNDGCTVLTPRHWLYFQPEGGILLKRNDGASCTMASGDLVRIVRQRGDPAFEETLDAMLAGDNGVDVKDL